MTLIFSIIIELFLVALFCIMIHDIIAAEKVRKRNEEEIKQMFKSLEKNK